MINPHIKNQRTGFHLDIQNRSSHYLKLINARSCFNSSNLHKPQPHSLHRIQPKTLQAVSKMRKSLQLPNYDHPRVFSKISQMDRKSNRNVTECDRYVEYQKELSIADDNIKMLRRIGTIESDLSKKKMKAFSKQMDRYAKIARNSSKNIELIDQLFYRQFKRQMVQGQPKADRAHTKANKRKLKKKLGSIRKPEVAEVKVEAID